VPGETIRDVIVRLSLQMKDERQISRINSQLRQIGTAQTATNARVLGLEQLQTQEILRRMRIQNNLTRELLNQLRIMQQITAEQRSQTGLAVAGAGGAWRARSIRGAIQQSAPFQGTQTAAFLLGKLALPVTIVAVAKPAVNAIWEGVNVLQKRSGEGLGNQLTALWKAAGQGLWGELAKQKIPLPPEARGVAEMFGDISKEIELKRELANTIAELIAKERAVIELEKERIANAEAEFGLMTQLEQQAVRDVSSRIKEGGIGALSGEELDFVRKNKAFAGLLEEEAKKRAQAEGFADIVAVSGAGQRIAAAEKSAQAKIDKLQVLNDIQVELDPTKLVDEIEAKLVPRIEQLTRRSVQMMLEQIEKLEVRNRVNQGALFGQR
jgi:hypothetical protein